MRRDKLVKELMDKISPPTFNGVPVEKSWTYQGLPCIVNYPAICYCGYVGVPKHYKIAKKTEDELSNLVKVHGGVTCREEKEDYVWFGFDCAHAWDEIVVKGRVINKGHHWTLDEVVAETEKMARQIKRLINKERKGQNVRKTT